jgi:hypothetical protein
VFEYRDSSIEALAASVGHVKKCEAKYASAIGQLSIALFFALVLFIRS